jgi:hypothetical protein
MPAAKAPRPRRIIVSNARLSSALALATEPLTFDDLLRMQTRPTGNDWTLFDERDWQETLAKVQRAEQAADEQRAKVGAMLGYDVEPEPA